MNSFNKLKLVLAFVTVAAVSACDSSTGTTYDPYTRAWYDVYGYNCNYGYPQPGCNFYSDGARIIDTEDPYYSGSYLLEYGAWTYYDTYGYSQYFSGWGWLSPSGMLYDEYGNALNEESQDSSRDWIAEAASKEEKVVKAAAKGLIDKHGLAEDKALDIAKGLNEYATLAKKRHRTDKDIADFTKRLYGISVEQATAALEKAKSGDMSGLESANDQIAAHWGTSPETSKAILKSWYKGR